MVFGLIGTIFRESDIDKKKSAAKRQLYGNSEEIAGRSADNVVCEFLDNNLNEKRFFP